MQRDFESAARKSRKLGLGIRPRTILMCVDCDTGKCASGKQMKESWKHLKHRLKELGLQRDDGVSRIKTQCIDICVGGPILGIFPDNVWYGGCVPAVIDRILSEHIIGGTLVDEYVISGTAKECNDTP